MNVWDELLSDRARLQPLALEDDAHRLAAVLSRYKLLRSSITSSIMVILMVMVLILFNWNISQTASLILSLLLFLYLIIWMNAMLRDSATSKAERSYIHQHKDSLATSIHARSALEPKDKAFGVSAVLARRGAVLHASYEDCTEGIFRSLAESVLRCTGSLDMLYLAAIESQAGGPSWVPKWDVQGSWPSRIDTTIAGLSAYVSQWHEHLHVSDLLAQEAEAAPFAIRGDSLHVEAYQLGVCTAVAKFREVDLALVDRSVHIANFRAAKACVRWAGDKFPGVLSVSPVPAHLRGWLRLLKRRDLEQKLLDLENGLEPQSIITMLPVHAEICNILARHDAMLCVARFRLPDTARVRRQTAWYEQPSVRAIFANYARVAVCSPRVQVGDTIVRVKGMHIPVMLHGQRLVSPFKRIDHGYHAYGFNSGNPPPPAQHVLYDNIPQRLEIL